MQVSRLALIVLLLLLVFSGSILPPAAAQSVASGKIQGTVTDPTGAVVSGAKVEIRNPISGYSQTTTTDSSGMFRFTNIPLNPYHLELNQPGFAVAAQDVTVRTTVPITVNISLM